MLSAESMPDDKITVEEYKTLDGFSFSENIKNKSVAEGGLLLSCTENGSDYVITKSFSPGPDLFYYKKLTFSIAITADAEYTAGLNLSISMQNGDTAVYSYTLKNDMPSIIEADLSSFRVSGDLAEIKLSFNVTGESSPAILISPISASGLVDSTLSERFMSDSYKSEIGSIMISPGKTTMTLEPNEGRAVIYGDVTSKSLPGKTNALRITLDNAARAKSLRIFYTTAATENFSDDKSFITELERTESTESYIIPFEKPENIVRIKLDFEGGDSDGINIYSLYPVSSYSSVSNPVGEVTECGVSDDLSYITIKGTLPSSFVSKNGSARIALFSLYPGDDAKEKLATSTPAAIYNMSSRFEFKLPLTDANYISLFMQYVVVIDTGNGYADDISFVDSPKYVGGIGKLAQFKENGREAPAFAGIYPQKLDLPAAPGAGYTILDVDVSKLVSESNNGYLHFVDGKYYYYDYDYLDELDKATSLYSGLGYTVLLRLVVGNPGYDAPYTFSYNDSGVRYYALNATDDDGIMYIHAMTDLLCRRYAGDQGTKIAGFVVGENIATSGEYNYMAVGVPLDDYVKNYMCALRTVYISAQRYATSLSVYAGLDNSWVSESVGRKFLSPDYDTILFLEALAARAQDEEGIEYSILWQADEDPIYSGSPNDYLVTSITVDNIKFLDDYIETLKAKYGYSGSELYLWNPQSPLDFDRKFAYSYYKLFGFSGFENFAVGFGADSEYKIFLLDIINKLDGDNTDELLAPYLGSSHDEKIPDDANYRAVIEKKLTTAPPEHLGSAYYFNFENDKDKGLFSALVGELVTSEALSGSFTDDIIGFYRSDGKIDNFSHTDIISTDFLVDGDGEYTVSLVLFSGRDSYTASATVDGGSREKLYCDLSGFSGIGKITALSFVVKCKSEIPTSTMTLFAIEGYSKQYTDDSLSVIIEEARTSPDKQSKLPSFGWVFVLAAAVAITAAAVIVISKERAK
jgi:hypothetical protein